MAQLFDAPAMMQVWRTALGAGREPSADQEVAITAPPTGRRSVNAGAGTGKTSTLALRALYLIEAGHVRADQIVVVTFTKKAAAEVASRISDTLDRALTVGATFGRSAHTVKCTTIHALAAQILSEFAFSFGHARPLRAVSDGEAYGIFHESFQALLAGQIGVDTTAFPIAEVDLEILERDLAKLALRLKNHGILPATFKTRALEQTDVFRALAWDQLWTAGFKGRPCDHKPKVKLTSQERSREADREQLNIGVVSALLRDFDRRLDERSAATYGDLIGRAQRLLESSPVVVRNLRARWRYLLLDESQDTSNLQLAFIEALFGRAGEPDAAGMMPVGDSRQAIYGFNGADEGVMERLSQAAESSHPLIVNRRSTQEIVDAGHAVLIAAGVADASTPQLYASAGSGGLACVRIETFGVDGESVKEHVEHEAGAIAGEVSRLMRDRDVSSNEIAILVRRRTHAAAYVRALNKCGIYAALDRRTGLLVADEIRDALAWMTLLLNLNDKQAAVRILQSRVCGLSDAAMIEIAADDDWLERFLGAELSTVDADSRVRLDSVRRHLTNLLPALSLPLPAALARILTEVPIAASYVQLGATIGAQAIVNLRSLEELAREFTAERPGLRLGDFVADINRRIRYDDDLAEPELEVDGVRVLTIHQAKGLEWKYVFVACTTPAQYANNEPSDRVVHYDLGSGAFAFKNDVDGRETFRWMTLTCEHDPATGQRDTSGARKMAREREQARVFYVGLTRAKRTVYVTAPVAGAKEPSYLTAIREWAASIDAEDDLRFTVPANDEPMRESLAGEDRAARQRGGRVLIERHNSVNAPGASTFRPRVSFTAIAAYTTCARMAHYRYRLLLPNLRDMQSDHRATGPSDEPELSDAARFGSLTHRALERWGAAALNDVPTASIEESVASAAAEFPVPPADGQRALLAARQAVGALTGYTIVGVEVPFEIAFDSVSVEGSIDLIARDPDGRLVVVDYKTGRADDEHYSLQLALYRRVVEVKYPGEPVAAALLRVRPEGAHFAFAPVISSIDLDAAVAAAGLFESDIPTVGPNCTTCAYRGSPCMAPLVNEAYRTEVLEPK